MIYTKQLNILLKSFYISEINLIKLAPLTYNITLNKKRIQSYAFYILSTFFLFFLKNFISNLFFLNSPLLSLPFPTLHSIPIAPINTLSDVPPAEINGIGIPVGGIEPLNISYCIVKLGIKKEQMFALLQLIDCSQLNLTTLHHLQHYMSKFQYNLYIQMKYLFLHNFYTQQTFYL